MIPFSLVSMQISVTFHPCTAKNVSFIHEGFNDRSLKEYYRFYRGPAGSWEEYRYRGNPPTWRYSLLGDTTPHAPLLTHDVYMYRGRLPQDKRD